MKSHYDDILSNRTLSLIVLVALSAILAVSVSSIYYANSNDNNYNTTTYEGEASEISVLGDIPLMTSPDTSLSYKADVTGSSSMRLGTDIDSIIILDDPDAVFEKIVAKLKSMSFDDIFSLFETGNDKYLYKAIEFRGAFNSIIVIADLTESDSAVKTYLTVYNINNNNGMAVLTEDQLDNISSMALRITDFKFYIVAGVLDMLFIVR